MNERLQRFWQDWRSFFVFVAVMLVFRSAVADWNQVPSGSMKPSILVGDRIVVDKLAYDLRVPFTLRRVAEWGAPQRGDVVTFPSPVDDRLYVKRVIGLPGDLVELRRNRLFVNSVEADYQPLSATQVSELAVDNTQDYEFFVESILGNERIVMLSKHPRNQGYSTQRPVRVPDGAYLMLGDNRDESGDFREIGWVGRERVLGRAHAIAFSVDWDHYSPRLDRFFRQLR